jgi:hypothetical protein
VSLTCTYGQHSSFFGTPITPIDRIRQIAEVRNPEPIPFYPENRVSEVILPGKQFKNPFYQFDPCHPCSIVLRKKMSTDGSTFTETVYSTGLRKPCHLKPFMVSGTNMQMLQIAQVRAIAKRNNIS